MIVNDISYSMIVPTCQSTVQATPYRVSRKNRSCKFEVNSFKIYLFPVNSIYKHA